MRFLEKIITQKFSDALHIACSTVNKTDVLVSWNFKQIVIFNKIRLNVRWNAVVFVAKR